MWRTTIEKATKVCVSRQLHLNAAQLPCASVCKTPNVESTDHVAEVKILRCHAEIKREALNEVAEMVLRRVFELGLVCFLSTGKCSCFAALTEKRRAFCASFSSKYLFSSSMPAKKAAFLSKCNP